MSVSQYCDKKISTLTQDSSILEAAQLMRTNHVGEVIIVQRQQGKTVPVGLITDRDLVIEIIAMEIDIDKITLGSIMCLELITVNHDSSLKQALELLQTNGIRRAPVVDSKGALFGIIAIEGILKVLSQDMTKVLKLFNNERRIEKQFRS